MADRAFDPSAGQEDITPQQNPAELSGADEATQVLDVSAVADDAILLDKLDNPRPDHLNEVPDAELRALLLAWRRDIASEPLPDLITVDEAAATVHDAVTARRGFWRSSKHRMLVPVAASAAALAIIFTGTGLAARDAQPGDTLWVLTKVLYESHARSVEAAVSARTELDHATTALDQGRVNDARAALAVAQAELEKVAAEDDLARLTDQHRMLAAKLAEPNTSPSESVPSSGSGEPTAATTTTPPVILSTSPNPGTTTSPTSSTSPTATSTTSSAPSDSPSTTKSTAPPASTESGAADPPNAG